MKNRKNGSLASFVATAVLLMMAATGMMLEPDHVVMLSMMMGASLLIGLTGSLQNWQTGVVRPLYSTYPATATSLKA